MDTSKSNVMHCTVPDEIVERSSWTILHVEVKIKTVLKRGVKRCDKGMSAIDHDFSFHLNAFYTPGVFRFTLHLSQWDMIHDR